MFQFMNDQCGPHFRKFATGWEAITLFQTPKKFWDSKILFLTKGNNENITSVFCCLLITCCAAATMVVFESGKWKMYVSQLINDQLGTPCCKIYFGVKIYFGLIYPKIDFEW